MSARINELVTEKLKSVELENEVKIASTVQRTLLPPATYVGQNIIIESLYQSATSCGGDWWGYIRTPNRMAIMIADATGHGLPSALITAAARSCISVIDQLATANPSYLDSPSKILEFANRVIYESAKGEIMMTFFCAIVDFETNEIRYSSAGHNPPWLFHKEGEAFILQSLTATGSRLGENLDLPRLEERVTQFGPEDILFLYTDGITEGKNTEMVQYGKKKLMKVVQSELKNGPKSLIERIRAEFTEHNLGKSLDDDITLVTAVLRPDQALIEEYVNKFSTSTTNQQELSKETRAAHAPELQT
jgi:sigma-B regulation protein RsbU (phosphoserine phosphatase)